MANSSDYTYNLALNIFCTFYELWCLKNRHEPTVNERISDNSWVQHRTGCKTRVGKQFLEVRFPLRFINQNDEADVHLENLDFKTRYAGRMFDEYHIGTINYPSGKRVLLFF